VATSDFGKDAIGKARTVLDNARAAIKRQDVGAVREQIEGLARTQRMFRGVVAKTP
jgi:molecular chaperone DnaK